MKIKFVLGNCYKIYNTNSKVYKFKFMGTNAQGQFLGEIFGSSQTTVIDYVFQPSFTEIEEFECLNQS